MTFYFFGGDGEATLCSVLDLLLLLCSGCKKYLTGLKIEIQGHKNLLKCDFQCSLISVLQNGWLMRSDTPVLTDETFDP